VRSISFSLFINFLEQIYTIYSGGNLDLTTVGKWNLKVNGKKCDEYKSLRYFEISLTTTLEDETFIEVKVSSVLNRISVKVNNKLI